MRKQFLTVLVLAALGVACASARVSAQAAPPVSPAPQSPPPVEPTPAPAQGPLPPNALTQSVCGNPVLAPSTTPPAGTTFIWTWELCFPSQGNQSSVEPETYLFYVKFPSLISRPAEGVWSPWNDAAENVAKGDFLILMRDTAFLDDLRIEVNDFTFPNGAVGRIVSYIGEERERVKIVDYRDGQGEPIKIIKRSDIDETLREKDIIVRLDAFVDPTMIRRVETVLDELMTEKGFANSRVSHTLTPVAGGPKLVNVTFIVAEGPKDKISRVDFTGNTAVSDGTLRKQLKENKPKGSIFTLGFLKGGGTWKETAFEEDAARVVDYYQREGYAKARVGAPELTVLRESKDGSERHVELRIPVIEGPRYRMGELTFDGNTVVQPGFLRGLYKMKPGEWYSRKELYDGFRTTQQVYGQLGYMEWTPAPMFKYSDDPDPIEQAITALVPPMIVAPEVPKAGGKQPDPVVDVSVLFQEGPQYFVNRITFAGNTTTRDNVIRREMRLYEGNVFDTEALKFSVRRLNQLGYFSEIFGDERDTKIDKAPDRPNTVDITMRLAEQNRNQLTFGAGVSQYEGVFGQLAFQTSNFLGRGESLTVQMTAGDRSQNYQVAFTEPYLFDRNITGGFDFFKRSLDYIGYYTQKSAGGNLIFGFPVANFSRMFFNYAYESVKIENLNEALIDQSCLSRVTGCGTIESVGDLSQLTSTQREILARNPFVLESLLLGQGGSRTISKVVPSFVHNTVDNPIFPNQGKKLTATIDLALLGGNTKYYKPRLEAIFFKRHLARTSFGFRALGEYIASVGDAPCLEDPTQQCKRNLPIFERLTLGGEYSIRGLDLRSVGPTVPGSVAVLGGNKSLLFNAEYLISLASQVRVVLFYDAGQVRDVGQSFAWKEDVTELVFPDPPLLSDALSIASLTDPNAPGVTTRVTGTASAFKTSTGVELRFFMPVLNVPFRLIYAWNPQRAGVLDNSLRPQKEQIFKFSVGTTF